MQNIVQKKLLIMQFMGVKPRLISPDVYGLSDTPWFACTHPTPEQCMISYAEYSKYDSSLDWLHPVILKISNDLQCHLVMAPGYAYFVSDDADFELPLDDNYNGFDDVSNIFEIVVDFLTFYNSINTSKNLV